ncbi:MAG: immunoglobulin-like domain-containing protein [Ketobacter sp.]
MTNLTLTASDTVSEGGTITYTATLDNPAGTAMTVTLNNGQVISIAAGATSGTVDVIASDDVYGGGDTASAAIDSVSGGNFENLVADSDAATTTINDDADETNLTLTATDTVSEGGTITYTASLDNPADTAMTVTLSNGEVINIAAGQTSGTVDVVAGGGDEQDASIESTAGGNFENLIVDGSPANTSIVDLPPTITITNLTVTEEAVSVGDVIATFASSDPGNDTLSHQLLNDTNNYFVLVGNEIQLTQNGVDAINNDSLNLSELDITVEVSAGGKTANDTGVSNIIRVNEAPETGSDSYSTTEGLNLTVASSNGVLANDSDPESDWMVVTSFATNASGSGAQTVNGTNTVTTELGGTVTLNADGSFSYQPPASVDHSLSDQQQDSFVYRTGDGNSESAWTAVTIDVSDTAPNAVNDADSVGYGNTTNGNLISGEGGNGADNIGQDATTVHSVEFNGVNYSTFDANNQITIDAEYGTLTVNRDGTYSYESTSSLEATTVGGGNLGTWSGVNLYGFQAGTSFTNGNRLNLSAADGTGNIMYQNGAGLGMNSNTFFDQSTQLDQRYGNAEAIAIDLTESALSATVTLGAVSADDGGVWYAYDSNFNLVDSGIFAGGTTQVQVNTESAFQYLVMSASDNNDDYNITSLEYVTDPEFSESFNYTIIDADGDTSSAELVVDHSALSVAVADTNTAYESSLQSGTEYGVRSATSEGNLLDNDEAVSAETSITEIVFDGVTYTPDSAGRIFVDSPQGSLIVYTRDDAANNVKAGDYEYTIDSNNLSGDDSSEVFGYTLSNGTASSSSELTINIVDDAPISNDTEKTLSSDGAAQTYNLVIVLDRSGSMGWDVNGRNSNANGFDPDSVRMDIARDALEQLFESYDVIGNVNIQIVDFSDNVTSSQWYTDDLNGANEYLSGVTPNGGTHYSTALDEVMNDFAPPAGDKTLVYFISDGEPTNNYGVSGAQQTTWETFLDDNNVDMSFGIGIGRVSVDSLEPIAYPNVDYNGDGVEDYAIQVSDANGLATTLLSTLDTGIISGSISILAGEGAAGLYVGADGGYIQSVVIDGQTYTYNPGVSDSVVVNTALGGKLTVNFVSGEYFYQVGYDESTVGEQEVFTITAIDGDGDSITADLTINLEYTPALDANRDTLLTNVEDGSVIVIPDKALLFNDTAGISAEVASVDNPIGGSVSRAGATEFIVESANAPLSESDFSAVATQISEQGGDSETIGLNNSIANAFDFTRSYFGADGSSLAGLDTSGYSAAYTGRLENNGLISGSDQDWLKISLAEGEFIWFDIDGASSTVQINVYDAAGVYLETIDDNGQPWGGYTAGDTGEYFVQITTADASSTDYQLYMSIDTSNANYEGPDLGFEYTLEDDGHSDSTKVDIHSVGAGNSIIGTEDDEILVGGSTDDALYGQSGSDALVGGAGDDTLDGGDDDDLLIGGTGEDTLTGGLGSDIFAWELNDGGILGVISTDVVTDFESSDVLDLRDLLVDESETSLTEYLYVEEQGGNTIVHISSTGGFSDGVYNAISEDQTIELSGVDLVSQFGGDQNAIIQDLINSGKLLTDL